MCQVQFYFSSKILKSKGKHLKKNHDIKHENNTFNLKYDAFVYYCNSHKLMKNKTKRSRFKKLTETSICT